MLAAHIVKKFHVYKNILSNEAKLQQNMNGDLNFIFIISLWAQSTF